jgi:hypothetical protein
MLQKTQYRAASGLYCSLNVMGWAEYVARVCVWGGRNICRILVGKPEGNIPVVEDGTR